MSRTAELLWYILGVGVLGVGALLIGMVVGRLVRKRLRSDEPTEAFTIQDLREMRTRGVITQQEYESMRAAIIGDLTSGSGSEPHSPPPQDPGSERQRPDSTAGPPPVGN